MTPILFLALSSVSAVELDGDGVFGGGQLSVSDDFEARYWASDDVLAGFEDRSTLYDYIEQVNRMNLLFSKDSVQFGMQFDEVILLGNRYYLDDVLQYERSIVPDDLLSPAPDQFFHLDKIFVKKNLGRRGSFQVGDHYACLLYTSPSPRDGLLSRMPSSA